MAVTTMFRLSAPEWTLMACGMLLPALGAQAGQNGADDSVRAMLAMMEGTYRSDPTVATDAELPDLLDRRVLVQAPTFGDYVMYWQLNSGPDSEVYRQRLLVFEATDDGEIVQTTWSFRTPERFVDAFDAPELFAELAADAVVATLPKGCDQVWRRTNTGWEGSVSPENCRVWSERRQMWRRIGADARLEADAYWQAERGFADDGRQVFGTPPGELYRLDRISD